MKKSFILLAILFVSFNAAAQLRKTTEWTFDASKKEVRVGDEIDLIFKARIIDDWYLYSSDIGEDVGPMPTEIVFEDSLSFELIGDLVPVDAKKKYDKIWEADVTYFEGIGEFRQRIRVLKKDLNLQGELSFQTCTDLTGLCIPGFQDVDFNFIKVVEGGGNQRPRPGNSGIQNHAKWTFETSQNEVNTGDEIELILKAKIDADWYLYSSDNEEGGPIPAEVFFEPSPTFEVVGSLIPINPKKKYDETFEMDVTYFKGYAEFRQKIKVLQSNLDIRGEVSYQTCSDITLLCVLGTADLQFNLAKVSGEDVASSGDYSKLLEAEGGASLWGFFIAAFLFGLAALLTPCVFPMIPMTVAFFTNNSQSRSQAKIKALSYGISIIAIYILIGLIFTSFFGVGLANDLATGAVANIIFFLVFVIFAISFFGYFEINLPTGFINKMDKKAEKGGFLGVFFMAFTLVLVSFSCTGPIVGTVLIQSFQGEVIKPVVGMLGFSSAFAIPFTVFAFFPGMLKDLPKSGGWLNSVKVVLGFIEIALGFKFLSVADQAYHWGLLDREVYIAIWFILAILLALYLFGVIRFPHDSKGQRIKPIALVVAISSIAFAVYLFQGFGNAPLTALAGYLPPEKTTDFSFQQALGLVEPEEKHDVTPEGFDGEVRHADFLELPHGLKGFFDYDQALAFAQKVNKPLFIDFTGHGCVNCRKMEQYVWSDPGVLKRLNEDFVVVAIYVDDKTELPESEWYTSTFDGKVKKTIGKQNFDFQIVKFNGNAQPYYVLLDNNEQPLVTPKAYDPSVEGFVQFLDEAKEEFNRR
ncbi:thioredoxin family protein [Roseivirga sp. E12]|uniref:protein-disulfide reductase DsbD family protein n=1 Tax=Roseivirga sp. E12 TaxID=2819237 RepID=UPI001ABC9D41|nr:thioredoxin family protein [Roseivirga sp. E12]MBO3699938.1 thioredoxin family protein [Roseivirga sp. E12]